MKIKKYQIRIKLEYLLDHLVKNKYFLNFLQAYYQLAIKTFAWAIRTYKFDPILKVYLKHSDWILPISDIDLAFLIKTQTPQEDVAFFQEFWKFYSRIRIFFPKLCEFQEIRFIRAEQLDNHPLKANTDALLLLTTDKWECLYSKPNASEDIPTSMKRTVECTRHLFIYSNLQWPLLAGQVITELKFIRFNKMILKIIQHLSYLEKKVPIEISDLESRLKNPGESAPLSTEESIAYNIYKSSQTMPLDPIQRRDSLVYSFQKIILLIHRTHCRHFNLTDNSVAAPHSADNDWLGDTLKTFIKEGEALFGHQFQLVVLKQISEYNARAFLLIDEHTDEGFFKKLMLFCNQYNQRLFKSKIRLTIATERILTSQFYALWGTYALEAHILLARESYNPQGLLKIKIPPPEWILWKIRNSISIFEEYYLPLLTSPLARGTGMDFCKIYERPEMEMLFHYFYYLKDREAYENDLTRVKGDANEILCIAASKYANDIGIQDWHPYLYASAYPYMKKMIRLIDEMACDKINQNKL